MRTLICCATGLLAWAACAAESKPGRLDPQPDLAPAVAFLAGNSRFVVGRLDGSLQFFDARTGLPGKVAVNK